MALVALSVALFAVLTGTAAADAPASPAITEPATDGQLVHPGDVHMEATGLPEQAEGEQAPCTDWAIRTSDSSQVAWQALCAKGTLAVHIHLGDGAFVGAYAGTLNWTSTPTTCCGLASTTARAGSALGPLDRSAPTRFISGGGIAWTPLEPGYVVDKVAGGLQLPLNIAFVPNPGSAPDAPLAYMTKLYGTIKVLRRDGTLSATRPACSTTTRPATSRGRARGV